MSAGRASEAPFVVVLILTWNRRDDVLRCVASLPRLRYPNYLPVVIDNASADDTVEELRVRHPELTILQNERNLGYAGGNNVGIRFAMARRAKYVQIVNMDTEVTADLLGELVRVAESDPRIAVVGCRNLLLEDPRRLWGAYGELTYGPFVVRTAGAGAPDGPAWQVVRDVDSVIGNGYLWRCAALESIGPLDERFFAYHEDLDWCQRARQAGYRVVYAGTAAILHKGGSTSDRRQARVVPQSYFLGRNGILFVQRHAGRAERARFAILCAAAFAGRWLRASGLSLLPSRTRSGARGRELRAFEAAFLRGALDGLRGRPVPFDRLGMADSVVPLNAGQP